MATNEKFYNDLSLGRKSELEVIELCCRLGAKITDMADLHTSFDILVDNDTYLEIKNQKSIENNEIVLELSNQFGGKGWFYKDDTCTDYCFHKNGTNRYFFIERIALHLYYEIYKDTVRKTNYYGCDIAYVNINELKDYCSRNNYKFRDYIDTKN